MPAMSLEATTNIAREFAHKPAVVTAFATLGGIWSAYLLNNIRYFAYHHFLRPTSLGKYKKSPSPAWALVTGASDGIGKGFAEELCSRGFNVVLHGRNKAKLQAVKDELLEQWPQVEIKVLVLEAVEAARNLDALEESVRWVANLNLKVLINNIGGSGGLKPAWLGFEQRTGEDTSMLVDLNAMFPTQITRVLLPTLIRNQPALILSIGSVCGEVPSPYASAYAGAKAYNKAWSRSLSLEMKAEGRDIEVIDILVGEVSSGSQPQDLSLFTPSSRRMAKDSLGKVGCGADVIWGYWPHHLQFGSILSLPRAIMENMIKGMVLEEKAKEETERKST